MPLNITGLIELVLDHLEAYRGHLDGQPVNDGIVAEILGVSDPRKLSVDLLKFGKQSVVSAIEDELRYVKECSVSLIEQLNWHSKKSTPSLSFDSIKYKKLCSDIQQERSPSRQKDLAKYGYYEPIRERLMADGFLVAPRGAALGAVFPVNDWVHGYPVSREGLFAQDLKERTDKLTQKYKLLGDEPDALTRMLENGKPPPGSPLSSAIGCLCISWTRVTHLDLTVYVPVLGLSGVVEKEPDVEFFASYCRQLALPCWSPDPVVPDPGIAPYTDNSKLDKLKEIVRRYAATLGSKGLLKKNAQPQTEEDRVMLLELRRMQTILVNYEKKKKQEYVEMRNRAQIEAGLTTNYETMIERANQAALGYRTRVLLGLRTPARQALLSYVSFREKKTHEDLSIEQLQDVKDGVDLWICGWHSLNCAEPAALMTAASLFGEGADVLICFPYEGLSDTGPSRNRPKETCPWCAAVELGFRSLTRNKGRVDQGVSSGRWDTEFTMNISNEPDEVLPTNVEFDANANDNEIIKRTRGTLGDKLVKNKDLDTRAYSQVVETKIGRLRSMYHLLGLLDPEVVALGRPLFDRARKFKRQRLLTD